MGKNTIKKWVPRVIIEELEDIKRENRLNTDIEGFANMKRYIDLGRETERIWRLDFRRKKR